MKKQMITASSILLTAFCFFQSARSFSQGPGIEWQQVYGGNKFDKLTCMEQTTDGGYILGGYAQSGLSGNKSEANCGSYDYWLVKTDVMGNILWQNSFCGDGADYLEHVVQTSDGGYFVAGYSNSNATSDKSENAVGEYDYWVIKTDAAGNIEWDNTIGGADHEELWCAEQTADGGYILGGNSNSYPSGDKSEGNLYGSFDWWVVKLNNSGTVVWENTIVANYNDKLTAIHQTSDGGYIAAGFSASGIAGDKTEEANGEDYWLIKFNSVGNIEWQNTIAGNSVDQLWDMIETTDGGYILAGSSSSTISLDKTEGNVGLQDYWVVKVNAMGNIMWQTVIGGNLNDILSGIRQTTDGGYILGGYSQSDVSGNKNEPNYGEYLSNDFWIIKLNSTGGAEWQNVIGGSKDDVLLSLDVCDDGGYILGGYSKSPASTDKTLESFGNYDYWIVKLAGAVTCEIPAAIYSDNITSTTVTIHWDAVAGATKYQINYRPVGGGGWLKKNSLMNAKNLTGLIPNTIYEYKIKTICGAEASSFSSLFNFTTLPLKEAGENFVPIAIGMEIYPNPASDQITVFSPQSSVHVPQPSVNDASIIITNISGKIIYQNELSAEVTIIDVSSYAAGIYFVEINNDGEFISDKFIKQ